LLVFRSRVFDYARMKVDQVVARVAQEQNTTQQGKKRKVRRHHEVSVRKEPGSEFYIYRVKLPGMKQRFKRSTGETTLAAAIVQAKVIRRQLLEDGQARTSMKRPGYATVGDVLGVWMERSRASTRKNNASALRKWVRSFVNGEEDGVSMTRLTAEAFERYLQKWPGSPQGRESTWRQIRAVFADEPMRWYKQAGLVLPEMEDFRAVRGKSKVREEFYEGYVPMPVEVLARMDAGAERLRKSADLEERKVWAVYALMRWCGLRNIEVAALRWEWLVRGQRGYLWKFERYQDEAGQWQMPKGRPGQVPVRTRLIGQLRWALKTRRSGFVIPRAHKTEAEVLTERKINGFVRPFVPERTKGAYELRKQFGAEVAQRDGIEVASRVLRHVDIKTTWKHYHALLNEPAPL
jgi:integrase